MNASISEVGKGTPTDTGKPAFPGTRAAVDGFFDQVMVNAEDANLRRNRLALLAQLRHHFTRIADLSCLPG